MPSRFRALRHSLDEARFGSARTLNLRLTLPTGDEAVARAERWLRERQAAGAAEVLIITGRGAHSLGGVPVVREAVRKLLARLRRAGVVRDVLDHTPGSFVVTLAPLSALRNAPTRRRDRARGATPPRTTPAALAALHPDTIALLRRVAECALEELGARDPAPFLEREMVTQLSHVVAGIPDGGDRELRLRTALAALLAEYEER